MILVKTSIILVFIVFFILPIQGWAAEYVLVTNIKNETSTMSHNQLKGFFLGDLALWPNGKKVLIARIDTSTSFQNFLRDFLDLNVDNFNANWRRKLFSGKAIPPKKFSTIDELINYLEKEPYSIAPVSEEEAKRSINLKIISIADK